MHPNSIYRHQSEQAALKLAAGRGFGVVTAQLETLFGAHVPFVVEGRALQLHLHRGNLLAKAAAANPVSVMMIVSLCDAYVSPQWYDLGPDQVPTWIYGAVHIHGTLRAMDDGMLEPLLIKLSSEFERRLAPKPEWRLDKVDDKAKQALMRAIQPFELTITHVQATDKFAQTKPGDALESLAKALPSSFGANVDQAIACVQHHAGLRSQESQGFQVSQGSQNSQGHIS